MIISPDKLNKASRKTQRAVRYEAELDDEAMDCIFAAKQTGELRLLIEGRVFSTAKYSHLPKYRQVAVESYIRGALDFAARSTGRKVRRASSVPPTARASSKPPAGNGTTARSKATKRRARTASGQFVRAATAATPELKAAARAETETVSGRWYDDLVPPAPIGFQLAK